jgi:hypothetical protein
MNWMKLIMFLIILPAFAAAQQESADQNLFGNDHWPHAKLILQDSSYVYFRKTAAADTVFRIPVSQVQSNLRNVPMVNFKSIDDAVQQFNKQNSTGIKLQLVGIGISLVGYGILVAAVGSTGTDPAMLTTGGIIAVAGGSLSLVGLAVELDSHKHVKRFNIIAHAVPYQ